MLYQYQLLTAMWQHSAGVKNLLSHFHGAVPWLSTSPVHAQWKDGVFSAPHYLTVLCLVQQLSCTEAPLLLGSVTLQLPWHPMSPGSHLRAVVPGASEPGDKAQPKGMLRPPKGDCTTLWSSSPSSLLQEKTLQNEAQQK